MKNKTGRGQDWRPEAAVLLKQELSNPTPTSMLLETIMQLSNHHTHSQCAQKGGQALLQASTHKVKDGSRQLEEYLTKGSSFLEKQ